MKKSVIIGGNTYNLTSPTIKGITLAGKCLGDIPNKNDIYEILNEKDKDTLCDTLSYFIAGDLSLSKRLSKGDKKEVVEAIKIIIVDFIQPILLRASLMAKNVSLMAAKPKL